MDLKATYDRIAEDWFNDHSEDTWWLNGFDTFAQHLPPGARVLDVGCGAGIKTKYFVQKGIEPVGIDFSDGMIAIAKREHPQQQFYVTDITRSLDIAGSFDGVFAMAVLLHIKKAQVADVARNITQGLRSGGYFYVALKEKTAGKPDEMVRKENEYGYEYERFFSFYTVPEVEAFLHDTGFNIVWKDVAMSNRTSWIQIIAQKA